MALGIPLPGLPIDSLLKGIETGSGLYSRIMQPILSREEMANRKALQEAQLAQQMKIHQDSLAIQQAAQARLAQMAPLQRHLAELQIQKAEMESDPAKKMAYINAIMSGIQGMTGEQQNSGRPEESNQNMGLLKGMGMPSLKEMQSPDTFHQHTKVPSMMDLQQGFGGISPKQQIAMQLAGIKIPRQDVYHGAARDAYDLERLRQQVGENSDVYQNAKAFYQAQIEAKQDLRDLRARTKAGLKQGEKEFFDPSSGAPLGKEIPLTAKERESEEGNILFNQLYPYVYKGAYPFSGEGSITRLEKAAKNYKTNPEARKLFDDFLLAEKMLAATTVNEASTLKAGRTNQTYNRLKESLDAQDIPVLVKKIIKQYQIPPSASLNASMRYQKLLSEARKKARTGTAATQRLYYNPELQAQYEAKKEELAPEKKRWKYNPDTGVLE